MFGASRVSAKRHRCAAETDWLDISQAADSTCVPTFDSDGYGQAHACALATGSVASPAGVSPSREGERLQCRPQAASGLATPVTPGVSRKSGRTSRPLCRHSTYDFAFRCREAGWHLHITETSKDMGLVSAGRRSHRIGTFRYIQLSMSKTTRSPIE